MQLEIDNKEKLKRELKNKRKAFEIKFVLFD
jgi:hypothetical protein